MMVALMVEMMAEQLAELMDGILVASKVGKLVVN
jgi:hypothetical protein